MASWTFGNRRTSMPTASSLASLLYSMASFSFEVTESPLEYQEGQYATNSETQLGVSRRFNVTEKEYEVPRYRQRKEKK
jgi:hypothetical protein